jgi:AraC-like DNA-binding protein
MENSINAKNQREERRTLFTEQSIKQPDKSKDQQKRTEAEFKMFTPAGGELRTFLDVPRDGLLYKPPCTTTDLAKSRAGDMYFHAYRAKRFQWWLSQYLFTDRATLIGKADIRLIEWHSFIKNAFANDWDGIYTSKPKFYQSNLSHVPYVNNKAFFEPGEYVTFDIHFDIEYLKEIAADFPLLYEYINRVLTDKPVSLVPASIILPDRIINGIYEIITCDLPEALAPKFYEDMVDILLMWLLKSLDKQLSKPKYSTTQREAANYVRELIIQDPALNLSIGELAQKVNISRTVLKECFSHEFSMSIHQFKTEQRVKKIRALMLDPTENPGSITEALKMCDVKYFYKFFRQHFKDTPEKWRERNAS